MSIRGITVCVDYADHLAKGLPRWMEGLDELVIVTTPTDAATQRFEDRPHGVEVFNTDIFYANGAKFNKGAALSEAVVKTGLRNGAEWILAFDADIIPPKNWREQIEQLQHFGLVPGMLYGATRYWTPDETPLHEMKVNPSRKMQEIGVIGFFMLFHATDMHIAKDPMFDMCWPHAGNYDTTFVQRWSPEHQVILPLQCIHMGTERQNWAGRGNGVVLNRDFLQHRRNCNDWERERMKHPPKLPLTSS